MTDAPLILIADDNKDDRLEMVKNLEAHGYRVIQAIDGGSARKVIHEHDVAAAIIDHFMAPYGGLEFARGARLDGIILPMMMVTSEETMDLLVESTHAGFMGYLKKPVAPERLAQAVQRMLRVHEKQR